MRRSEASRHLWPRPSAAILCFLLISVRICGGDPFGGPLPPSTDDRERHRAAEEDPPPLRDDWPSVRGGAGDATAPDDAAEALISVGVLYEEYGGGGDGFDRAEDDGDDSPLLPRDQYEAHLDEAHGLYVSTFVDPNDVRRDHRQHHVRRTLQADLCIGYPRGFTQYIYIVLFDFFRYLDETEIEVMERIILNALNQCKTSCIEITSVRIIMQELQELDASGNVNVIPEGNERRAWRALQDQEPEAEPEPEEAEEANQQQKKPKKRRRRPAGGGNANTGNAKPTNRIRSRRKRLILKVEVSGICYACDDEPLTLDSINRRGRRMAGGQYSDRRRLQSCTDILQQMIGSSGDPDLAECVTSVDIMKNDPRCM